MGGGADSIGRPTLAALGTAGAYFLTAEFCAQISFPSAPVSVLWAPNAIVLGALALAKPKHWWLYLAAVCAAHFAAQWAACPPGQVITQFFANAGVAVFGAVALRSAGDTVPSFDRLRATINLLVFGAFLGPLLTSLALSAMFVLLHLTDEFWLTTVARTATNAFAVLVLVPTISFGAQELRTRRVRINWLRVAEALALSAAIIVVATIVFVYSGGVSPSLLYAPVPLLLLATVRFGAVGVSGSLLLVAMVAAWGVLKHGGPFAYAEPVESALSFVFFLLLNAVSLLLLAGVLGERKAAITATQVSEQRRQQSDELYRAILATCENCIAVVDREGGVIELNETWRQRMGLDRSVPAITAPGANYFNCLDTWDSGGAARLLEPAVRAVLSGDEVKRRVEYSMQASDGSVRWIEHMIERLARPEGGVVIMISDITTQKSAELEAQARYQELTHLARVAAVGGISGAIAHELNQPLGAILGNAEAGLRLLTREKTGIDELRDIFRDIVENSVRAADVIERVRGLLRPGGTGVREPVNLSILVADVLRLVSNELARRRVHLRTDLPASLGLVEADPIQIQQVVLNLVMNACEALDMSPTPERRIVVNTVLSRRRREVELTVRDFGPGVPKAEIERVFLPFVTSKPAGLGLGLFISRRIIQSHRGRLWVEPAEPGSTFHMTLPLRD